MDNGDREEDRGRDSAEEPQNGGRGEKVEKLKTESKERV